MSRVRVLVADEQPLMRAGLKAVLEATGSIGVVEEAGDGEEAIRAAEAHRRDVMLMDIRMPGADGIEATRRMPHRRVLVLTTFGLDEHIFEALRAGASGFLTKDAPAADGLDALTEREVLHLMAGGLSNAEIASALVVAEPTVKTHVSNVLGKLGLRDRVQLVIFDEHGLVRSFG